MVQALKRSQTLQDDKYGRELYEAIQINDPSGQVDMDLVQRAFDLAVRYHDGQNRKSGEPYYSHPVAVAAILASFDCSADMLSAALLHDTVEDTAFDTKKLSLIFNKNISDLVDKVTNFDTTKNIKINKSANIYKINTDRRALLIKICDRTHNTRTMWHMPHHKVKKKLDENFDFLIPIAKREGLVKPAQMLEEISIEVRDHFMNKIERGDFKNPCSHAASSRLR